MPQSHGFIYETNRITDIENRLVVVKGRGVGDGWIGVSRCKLVYTEWMNNKVYCIIQGTTFNIL